MQIIPPKIAHSKLKPHPSACDRRAARRLAALAYSASHCPPTFAGWAVLHSAWRDLEWICAGDPELASEWRRIDRLLGGFGPSAPSLGSVAQNVKGKFSAGSMAENFLRSGWPLTGKYQKKIPNVVGSGR